MKTVQVEVTLDDIRQGVRRECKKCPVALAIARALGKAEVFVGCLFVRVNCQQFTQDYVGMPHSVSNWIGQFDHQIPVEPFAFALDVPDSWLEPSHD